MARFISSSVVEHLQGLHRDGQSAHGASQLPPHVLVDAVKAVDVPRCPHHRGRANALGTDWASAFRVSRLLLKGSLDLDPLLPHSARSLCISIAEVPVEDLMRHQDHQDARLLEQLQNWVLPFFG